MSLYQIAAPDLLPLAVGGTTLYLLEGLGFSRDGKSLLVRATFTDSADVGAVFHYGVWLYDLATQQYTRCLNTELAASTAGAQLLDIKSASLVGTGSDLVIMAETSVRGSGEESKLALTGSDGVLDFNLLATVLDPDIQPQIERYSLSADGRFLALQTVSELLAPVDSPDTNSSSDIYLLDLLIRQVDRVSFVGGSEVMLPTYLGNVITIDDKVQVAFSTDAVFSTADKNATSSDPTDAYLWSSSFDASGLTGAPTFSLASAIAQASGGNQASGFVDAESPIVATPAGVFFNSKSADLISSDTNGAQDAFLNPSTLATTRVTLSGQAELDAGASFLSASSSGRFVALLTSSPEVSGAPDVQQMVVLDQQTGAWHVASQNGSMLANDWVVGGVMAPNGALVAFTSAADNLSATAPVALGGSLFVATTGFDTNTAPTGSVSISGTATQGQVLTVVNTLADADGLGTIVYQWLADGVAISGVTDSSYTLTEAEVGKVISVTASYTDGQGSDESVASVQTPEVVQAADLVGMVYHWKNHALLDGVGIQISGSDGTFDSLTAQGHFDFNGLAADGYLLIASWAVGNQRNAVTVGDALAALRIVKALNPNPDPDGTGPLPAPLFSPYQVMAADVDGDKTVTMADVKGILRMAVNAEGAPAPEWYFVEETRDFWDDTSALYTLTGASAGWDPEILTEVGANGSQANLVAVLKGDVNGSWEAPAGTEYLTDAYFAELAAMIGVPVGQWAV